jgi:hypothetical protein
MLGMSAKSASVVSLLTTGSKAATANATGTGVLVAPYEGDLMVTQVVGVITGTLDGKLQQCDDSSGTNAEDITGATFTQVTTSNDDPNVQTCIIGAGSLTRPYLRYVGTIGTGPSLVGVTLHSRPKYLSGAD